MNSRTPKGQLFTEIVLENFSLSGLLVTTGDKMTKPLGLNSARWKILGALAQAQSQSDTLLTVSQVARRMGQSRQAVQRLVDLMEKGDLLSFKDNPNHKRAKLLALTKKGESAYKEMDTIQAPWANQTSEGISVSDLETTLLTLKKISQQLKG